MQPISAIAPGAVQAPRSAAGVREPREVLQPEEEGQGRPRKPVMDEYVPEERGAPDPRADKKASGGRAERTTCDTGAVDRELETLRKRRADLEQQLHAETDGRKMEELEKKLAQVEGELRQKDNDTYRRQHAVFS